VITSTRNSITEHSFCGATSPAPDGLEVRTACDQRAWDAFVDQHPAGAFCHLWSVHDAIHRAYRHPVIRLAAFRQPAGLSAGALPARMAGILPMVHIRHRLLGNSLVSLPFLDFGGSLSERPVVDQALVEAARRIGARLGARRLEIRRRQLPADIGGEAAGSWTAPDALVRTHKVRMVLSLPRSSGELMRSFKSKLRSQITKAMREGLTIESGSLELLERFYDVFAVNMRDLGSPVHSKGFIAALLSAFPDRGRVFLVRRANMPLAAGIVFGFKDTVINPWASSLRAYSRMNPNMLLYWGMLQDACDRGFQWFDFGRSTPGEGTYRFKEQWGARPAACPWEIIALDGRAVGKGESLADAPLFRLAGKSWQRLPVWLTRLIGPPIRKFIPL
jgi:FemAB-related protein (PEP-CTERM system-associated)